MNKRTLLAFVISFIMIIGMVQIAFGDVIWTEDFNAEEDQGVGATGPIPQGTNQGVTAPNSGKWSVDVSAADLSASSDWFRVQNYLFETRDSDGECVWTSEGISITGYSGGQFSIDLSESGNHEASDYIKVYYTIDGGAEILAVEISDDFDPFTHTETGLAGDTLVIIVKTNNNSGSEYLRFENVIVEGTPAGAVADPSDFTATTVDTSQIDLSWNENANNDSVLVAWNSTNTFGTPVNGTSYGSGSGIPGGGTSLGNNGDSTYSHTSLLTDTWYYYKIWSFDATTTYSSGVIDSSKTYMPVPTLYINEFMADNDNIIQDPQGQYDDWIEIYNPGASPVDIGGMYMSDDLANPSKYQIPDTVSAQTTIPAGGFLLLWADNQTADGVLHLGFSLSKNGEAVGLFGTDGLTPIDTYTFGAQTTDVSEARQTDGSPTWVNFLIPTPDATNNTEYLMVISPNGGEQWEQNSSHDITWYSQNFTDSVAIVLLQGGVKEERATVLVANTYNDGTWQWNIPAGQTIASDYIIKISDANDGIPSDESDTTFSIVASGSTPQPGDVIVNEIMQNPAAVSDGNGEYVEIYNTTDHNIDINGWIIKDKDGNQHTIDNGAPLMIYSYDYLVLGRDADSTANGGYHCDYQYSDFYLSNSDDEVILVFGSVIIDSVYYDGGPVFPDPNGASMELDPAYQNGTDNDNGANWYTAYTPFGAGDFGTPGSVNPGPQTATEYTIYQLQSEDHSGELIRTSGIVTGVYSSQYTIQDGTGNYSGIWVNGTGVARGDSVTVEGIVNENYDLTLITADSLLINSSGNPLPSPEILTTGAVGVEEYEGVLVKTSGDCTNENPDAPNDYGEWVINDGSDSIRIDDLGYLYEPTLGNTYEVTGPLYYSYSNFKIEPRDSTDIVETGVQPSAPVNVNIEMIANGDSVRITWVNENHTYRIYSSDDPYAVFVPGGPNPDWTLRETVVNVGEAIIQAGEAKKFYLVTAE